MLTLEEKNKIKEILSEGLNINKNINFPYFWIVYSKQARM